MSTIRTYVEAMGVDPADLQDTDEYFEVVHTLVVGTPGNPVYEQAKLINPANTLQPTDTIQIRRRIGALGDDLDRLGDAIAADNPVLYLPGVVGFDGAQAKIAHAAALPPGAFSLEFMVRYDGPGSVAPTDYGTICGYNGNHRLLVKSDGAVLAQVGGVNCMTAAGVLPVGERTHVVFTFDGATQRIYVAGTQAAAVAAGGSPAFIAAFWEGAYGDPSVAYSFRGALDHRAFYSYALPAARVAAHASVA